LIKKFPSVWKKLSENRRVDFLTHTVVRNPGFQLISN